MMVHRRGKFLFLFFFLGCFLTPLSSPLGAGEAATPSPPEKQHPSAAAAKPLKVTTQILKRDRGVLQLVFAWPQKIKGTAQVKDKQLSFHFPKGGSLNHGALAAQLPRTFKLISVTRSNSPLTVRLRSASFYDVAEEHADNKTIFTLTPNLKKDAAEKAKQQKEKAASQPEPKPIQIKPKENKKPPTPAERKAKKVVPVNVKWAHTDKSQEISFDWPSDVRMAAFWHGEYFWIVFDAPATFHHQGLNTALKNEEVREAQSGHDKEISWVRFIPNRHNYPVPKLDKKKWRLTFFDQEEPPEEPLALGIKRRDFGAKEAIIPVTNTTRAYTIKDPIFQKTLYVVPLKSPGTTFAEERHFVQYSMLPAVQGIALTPQTDTFKVTVDPTQIVLQDTPEILLSKAPHLEGVIDGQFTSLLQFYHWMRLEKPWAVLHHELKDAVYKSRGNSRIKAKIDLARFYLESGLDVEALNTLKGMKERNTYLLKDPHFLALYTVSLIADRQFQEAEKMLANPLLNKDPEMRIWRGVIHAMTGNWKEAQRDMKFSLAFAKTYPPQIQHHILLLTAEVMAKRGSLRQAKKYLQAIEKKTLANRALNYMHYVQGLIENLQEHHDKAEMYWQQAFDQGDHFTKAKAGFALIQKNLERPEANLKNDIQRLERLKYFWRGDYIEYEIMIALAKLYHQEKDYYAALETVKRLQRTRLNEPQQKETYALKRKIFEQLYTEDFTKMDPIRALAIYEENKHFLKESPKIIAIQNKVIEEYMRLNLARRALTVLEDLRTHIPPEDLFQNSMRHVAILLLDDQPQLALQKLEGVKPQDEDEATQHRHMLARTHIMLKQTPLALTVLEKDFSYEADLLRATIYRKEENWEIAGDIFLKLSENKKATPKEMETYLLNAVICYTLAEAPEKLSQLRTLNRERIRGSENRILYDLLLNESEAQKDHQEQYLETLNTFFEKSDEILKNIAKI